MKKLIGAASALLLLTIAIFDVGRENKEILGLGPVIILLLFGLIMWLLLSKLAGNQSGKASAITIRSTLWSHSILEGALAALSFDFGIRAGLIVSSALLIHLLPESLAIMAIMKSSGFGYRYALKTYAVTVVLLLASLGLSSLMLPKSSNSLLAGLSTVVAGGFIYLALTFFYRQSLVSQT